MRKVLRVPSSIALLHFLLLLPTLPNFQYPYHDIRYDVHLWLSLGEPWGLHSRASWLYPINRRPRNTCLWERLLDYSGTKKAMQSLTDIKQLARSFSQQSLCSENISNPFNTEDSELKPNSDSFRPEKWIRALLELARGDSLYMMRKSGGFVIPIPYMHGWVRWINYLGWPLRHTSSSDAVVGDPGEDM